MIRSEPHMGFVGVTTARSSIRKVYPGWANILDLPTTRLVGYDLPIGTSSQEYRDLVKRLADDPGHLGSLVTTHKIGVYEAAADLFGHLDEHAVRFGEISCISKRDVGLVGHAVDPISARLAMDEFIPPDHFAKTGGAVYCLGMGGAGSAISYLLGERADAPSEIVCTAARQASLDHAATIHASVASTGRFRYELVDRHRPVDSLLASAPEGSLVVNATGMGKDRPGSPLSDDFVFPHGGIVWEINYRGSLEFLDQARNQAETRDLRVEDGWRYFIHGWSQVIAQVFDIPMPPETVDRLAAFAETVR
jgi:shikimate dehydrogenase